MLRCIIFAEQLFSIRRTPLLRQTKPKLFPHIFLFKAFLVPWADSLTYKREITRTCVRGTV